MKRSRETTDKDLDDNKLKELIMAGYSKFKGIYGYRRMVTWLQRNHGTKVNHKRVYRLMKCMNIKAVIRRKKKYFGGAESLILADNIQNRDFKTDRADSKWVTDVTYLIYNNRKDYIFQ